MDDISLDQSYGTLLGYTEDDLHHYFGDWLDRAVDVLKLPNRQVLVDQMRRMYDRFCFDRAASTHVYSPWSVLNFLNNPEEGLIQSVQ